MDNDRLGYPGVGQQEHLYPVGIEGRSPISRILTDSTDRDIISAARARICAGRRGEGKTLIFPRTSRSSLGTTLHPLHQLHVSK